MGPIMSRTDKASEDGNSRYRPHSIKQSSQWAVPTDQNQLSNWLINVVTSLMFTLPSPLVSPVAGATPSSATMPENIFQ